MLEAILVKELPPMTPAQQDGRRDIVNMPSKGRKLLIALELILVAPTTVLAIAMFYIAGRYENWGFVALVGDAFTLAMATFVVWIPFWLILHRRATSLFLWVFCLVFGLPIAVTLSARCLFWHEFEQNREKANAIIVAINQYRNEHGAYPSSIELLKDLPQLRCGRKTIPLTYFKGKRPPVLSYWYGGIEYIYDFEDGGWTEHD